jgi:hypothetical protein
MALISEWMEQCGKKVLDNAGIVRDAYLLQLPMTTVIFWLLVPRTTIESCAFFDA